MLKRRPVPIVSRKEFPMFFRSFLVCGVVLGGISGANAQIRHPQRYGGQNFVPRVEKVSVTGTVKSKMSGVLLIATENRGNLMIGVNPKTKVTFTGEAKPPFFRPGMCVAFKAVVDAKGSASDKIDELSVFTPSMEKMLGMFPESSDAEAAPAKKSAKKSKEPVLYEVRGKLMGYNPRDGRIQVQALRVLVRGQLAEDPKISVEINDASFFSFVGEGDKVSAEVLPSAPDRGQALTLKIEAAKTLGEVAQKPPLKPGDRKKPLPEPKPKQPAPDKGLPAPAEDK
jgi:hypothetical protein